ncbi:unnamed protein product [Lampetra fluviatilis]
MPTPQDPPRAPDERLGTDAVLREAHSRLSELLLAAASILADINTSGGAGTSADIQQGRPADSRQNDLAIPAISTARTSFGGNGDQHVAAVLQAHPLTSSTRAADHHQPPAIGAAILQTDAQVFGASGNVGLVRRYGAAGTARHVGRRRARGLQVRTEIGPLHA